MNLITNTWRQLIRRRLWPIALLLVAALVAVPMKLAKKPEAAPPVPAAAIAKAEQAEAEAKPVVQLKTTSETSGKQRRRVLGQAKDPFAPAPLPKKKKAKAAATATPAPTEAPSDSGSAGGGSSAPPSSAPAAPKVPTVTLPKGMLKVRFGPTDSDTAAELPTFFINRLEPIPNTTTPVLVFEGTRDNGRSALFSIPGDVTAVGDGKCDPTPQDCAELKLRAGQTEFVTVKGAGPNGTDAEFELDLVKIFDKATQVPKAEVDKAASSGNS
jgi:hypothetical protein